MIDYNSETEPCWVPLMKLIETRLFDIVRTEDAAGRCIRLYGAGNYWHAFEESAYQLSLLFGTDGIIVFKHKIYPFLAVMASISDDELQAYGKNHIFKRKFPGYRKLVGVEISMKQYKEWHQKKAIQFFLPPPSHK